MSLFAYLILYPQAHPREKLAALFWGDSNNAKAHASLRSAVTSLRKSIDDEIVIADRDCVRLNPEFPLWVDVLEFERQAREFITNSLTELNRVDLDLYQGDLLCDHYDDWVVPLREYHHALYLKVLFRVVEGLRAQSEYKTAIEFAQKILAVDPVNERAYQHLMFCHIVLGYRNEALQQYEACRRALLNELKVEPARETQALYRWIKQSPPETTTLAARLTNLPIPFSSFVGRSRELTRIKQLISTTRLVTLTGAGGSGKTRLAIHAAIDLIDSFKDGVWWVELASLTDTSLLPAAVAKALGVSGQTGQPLTETLSHVLRTRQILLSLDNCEHLIGACARLVEHLLNACPDLKILCTSREALGLTGENVWYVPALSLPQMNVVSFTDLLMQYEGICLFVERAQAVKPSFLLSDENAPGVLQICQRLDGIPLAIELAAARVKTLSVDQIATRLNDRFHLLTAENRNMQKRHQTLRAAVGWSYNLLSDDERQLFCRLSVFSAGWTLDAAESVCSGEGIEKQDVLKLLARLVDKSLVSALDDQRYGMLETLREYSTVRLVEAGKQDWVNRQYLGYFLKMAGEADEKIRGPGQLEWLKWFETERDNLAGAIEKALSSPATLDKGCELVCSLCWYWVIAGDFVAMRHWLEITLPRSAALGVTVTRARVLFCAGYYSVQGLNWLEPLAAQSMLEESQEIWRTLGPSYAVEYAQCVLGVAWIRKAILNDDLGYVLFDQAIAVFQERGNIWWHAWALNLLGALWVEDSRDLQMIHQILEEEFTLWKRTGDQCVSALPLFDLGTLALERHDLIEAQRYFEESLKRYEKFSARGLIFQAVNYLADIARGLKQYRRAEERYLENVPLAGTLLLESSLSAIYYGLGFVALHLDRDQEAEGYFIQALNIAREYDMVWRIRLCIAGFASLATIRKKYLTAAHLFSASLAQMEVLQSGTSRRKTIGPVEQIEIDEYLALCRSQVDVIVFEQAWRAGRTLTLDETLSEIMTTLVEKNS